MDMASCPRLVPSGVTVQLSVVRTAKVGVETAIATAVAMATAYIRESIGVGPAKQRRSFSHPRASFCRGTTTIATTMASRSTIDLSEFATEPVHGRLFTLSGCFQGATNR